MIFTLVIGAAIAALTWAIGWWAVLLAGSIVGFAYYHERGRAWYVAIAAAAAWSALLLADAALGPIGRVGHTLAGVLRAPAALLVLLTLAFPALVAWSAATVVAGVRQRVVTRRR